MHMQKWTGEKTEGMSDMGGKDLTQMNTDVFYVSRFF